MPYMTLLQEKVLLADGAWVEVELDSGGAYRLRYGDMVEYANGRRRMRGRSLPYEFRSVEQLRYDFERDVEEQGGRFGEAA